ncbi:growth arrest and DNA damage-inducible protein GADD45 beta isoform X1 [Leopardus geoffroyi]|nr:growth arrest and DNA damage-inducible protein GADD45 beta isoform X1 [Leopardus geoffroyi]
MRQRGAEDADRERRGGGAAGGRAAPGPPHRGGVRVSQVDECVSHTPSPDWARVGTPSALHALCCTPLPHVARISPKHPHCGLRVSVLSLGGGGSRGCSILTLHRLQAPTAVFAGALPAPPPPPQASRTVRPLPTPAAACRRDPWRAFGFSSLFQTPPCTVASPQPPADPSPPSGPLRDPDSVVLCLLAIDEEEEDDIALQIHFTLIQSFCCDNDINIVRVSGMQRLAQLLGEPAETQGTTEARDLHCLLVTNPHTDAWKSHGLVEVASYCEESRGNNQWVPYISLQER